MLVKQNGAFSVIHQMLVPLNYMVAEYLHAGFTFRIKAQHLNELRKVFSPFVFDKFNAFMLLENLLQ